MKKLSQTDANYFVYKAHAKTSNIYRFGQALYNLLPYEITSVINNTEYDFFYDTDHDTVIKKFYDNCVLTGE